MLTTDWKGGDAPRFGRKARAWFRRRLTQALFPACGTDDEGEYWACSKDGDAERWAHSAVDMLLDWYMTDPLRYVTRVESDHYQGTGYSDGSWKFNADAVARGVGAGMRYVDQQIDAKKCSTLDEWLKADIAGELTYSGDPGGMAKVPAECAIRLTEAKRRRARNRVCACGQAFVADRANARRCDSCRSVLRAARSPHGR